MPLAWLDAYLQGSISEADEIMKLLRKAELAEAKYSREEDAYG